MNYDDKMSPSSLSDTESSKRFDKSSTTSHMESFSFSALHFLRNRLMPTGKVFGFPSDFCKTIKRENSNPARLWILLTPECVPKPSFTASRYDSAAGKVFYAIKNVVGLGVLVEFAFNICQIAALKSEIDEIADELE